MTITQDRRDALLRSLRPVKAKLDILEKHTHPVNRRIFRQLVGLKEFGWRYLVFILARVGLLPRWEFRPALFWGERVVLPADRTTTEIAYLGSLPEINLVSFFLKTLKEGDVFYDVGASYGFYTLLAKELVGSGSVHSFEPSPAVFPYLLKNAAAAGDVHLNNVAVAEKPGSMPFFHVDGFTTQSTIVPDVAASNPLGHSVITVPVVALDEYAKTHPAPTVMKIDIEGGELGALRGAVGLLKAHAPMVVLEVWGGEQGRRFSEGAVRFLRELGYRPFRIASDGTISREDTSDLIATTLGDNFVFIK